MLLQRQHAALQELVRGQELYYNVKSLCSYTKQFSMILFLSPTSQTTQRKDVDMRSPFFTCSKINCQRMIQAEGSLASCIVCATPSVIKEVLNLCCGILNIAEAECLTMLVRGRPKTPELERIKRRRESHHCCNMAIFSIIAVWIVALSS